MTKIYLLTSLKKTNIWRILIGLLLVVPAFVNAQTTILSGNVTDMLTRKGIAGVSLLVKGSSAGTSTDANGDFKLTVKRKSPLVLVVSAIGYSMKEVHVDGSAANLTIALETEHILADEVVVSASRVQERMIESPVAIERMGPESIRMSAANSFYDALANLKGVEQSIQSFTFTSINTRGFNANGNVRFNQFIDGMDNQAPGLNFAVGNIVGISDLDLESAELLPGSSSALYGAGGINGTLLLNSKDPFRYQGLSFQLKTGVSHFNDEIQKPGSWNDVQLRYAKAWNNKLAFKVNLSYIKANDWRARDYSNFDRTKQMAKAGNRDTDPAYDGVNVYGDEIKANMRMVAQSVITAGRSAYISQYQAATGGMTPSETQIQIFLATNPQTSPFYQGLQAGIIPDQDVSRTGYKEADLFDAGTEALRTSISLNYKITPGIEAVAQAYWGTGTSAYTGADRFSLNNFNLGQYKLELKGRNFFLRGYTTQERSGDTYDAVALASYMNEASKASTVWFPQYVGTYVGAIAAGANDAQANQAARAAADQGHYQPGSSEFNTTKAAIVSQTIGAGPGAKFNDKTNLYHYEGMYNFSDLLPETELLAGASYRLYDLNSGGTIFDDLNRKLTIREYGAYAQAARKLFKERLKLQLALRYDKNENFAGRLTPRISGVITVAKNNTLRLSYQTGYRNPTAQGQYIDILVRAGSRLVGALPQMLDKYNLRTNKPYTDESYQAFIAGGGADPSVLQSYTFNQFKPESVQSYEAGYRSLVGDKLFLDTYYYYNVFHNYLAGVVVWQNPTPGDLSGMAMPTRYEMSANSTEKVITHGWGLGLEYKLGKFTWSGNVSHDKLTGLPKQFLNMYNTPEYRFNIGIRNEQLLKNIGFNVVYRWQDQFRWLSTFVEGQVPAYGSLDGQLSFKLPQYQSVVKIGGSNLLNRYYRTSYGNPAIGAAYYVSLVFNQ
ncbi:TonB-dependent receptor plug domain-containing protein [Pedobacter sp. BS3]|uniref:TonB-dependent receptor n=1 Tax=Pedobacter sp. BS3 TaxID=2567937 RepID=UPI0011ED9C8C|nr:TonB-dependent receptor [Pedobacter sp. BS3]TZF83148.1 TonB-dependent receptor plug domain-containing protein [Pedobacter sp. BS3]